MLVFVGKTLAIFILPFNAHSGDERSKEGEDLKFENGIERKEENVLNVKELRPSRILCFPRISLCDYLGLHNMGIFQVLDVSAFQASDRIGIQQLVDGDFFASAAMNDLIGAVHPAGARVAMLLL